MAVEDGIRLKEIRTIINKNQKEFSELLEINQATYSKYETGNLDIPDNIKKKLIFQFGISLNWLLAGDGEMFTNGTGPGGDELEKARVKVQEKDNEIKRLQEELDKTAKLLKNLDDLEKQNTELSQELLDKYRELNKIKDQHLGFST